MENEILIRNCRLYNQNHNTPVNILIKNGKIFSVTQSAENLFAKKTIDASGQIVSPGFIDIHIQGAGGFDILDGTIEGLETMSKTLARFGTTGFLATTIVRSKTSNNHLKTAAAAAQTRLPGAQILGIHLEGPFINPVKKGGISPDSIFPASINGLNKIINLTGRELKMMTIAPEMESNLDIIRRLKKLGIIASFGHSNANYSETKKGIEAGISHATHLFNAMNPIHHREPGPIPAILEDRQATVQIIADGVHLSGPVIKMCYQLFSADRIICITDGIQAIGLPEGRYFYNGREFESKNGAARYLDGTLIGTAISLNKIVKRFKKFTGCSLAEAINTVTINPAKLLKIGDKKGSIEEGKDADIIILDENFDVSTTIINGKIVYAKQS